MTASSLKKSSNRQKSQLSRDRKFYKCAMRQHWNILQFTYFWQHCNGHKWTWRIEIMRISQLQDVKLKPNGASPFFRRKMWFFRKIRNFSCHLKELEFRKKKKHGSVYITRGNFSDIKPSSDFQKKSVFRSTLLPLQLSPLSKGKGNPWERKRQETSTVSWSNMSRFLTLRLCIFAVNFFFMQSIFVVDQSHIEE